MFRRYPGLSEFKAQPVCPLLSQTDGSRVFSLQSVISPAEPVMYIIPQDQPLVISARIDPVHVDQVHIGQAATLRFAAFDQRKTPQTRGKVTRISADVFTDEVSGKDRAHAYAINEGGDVVGYSFDEFGSGATATLWKDVSII